MKWPIQTERPSLKTRLSAALASLVTVFWLLGIGAAAFALNHEIDEVFDSAIQEVAQAVLPIVLNDAFEARSGVTANSTVYVVDSPPHKEQITYIVRDATGRVLLRSHDAVATAFPTSLGTGFADGPSARAYTEQSKDGTFFVTTTERVGHRKKVVFDAVSLLLWPLILLLPINLLAIWQTVRITFRPIISFRKEVETRGEGNLAPIQTDRLPMEIFPTANAVNQLIGRLKNSRDAERRFAANSAHELRTPVAAALAQTQRLLAEVPAGPGHVRASAIQAALKRLTRLSEKLLQLTNAESAQLAANEPQDLIPVLNLVMADFIADPAIANRIEVSLPKRKHFISRLDIDAFAILARNLIENALKHGDDRSPVRIILSDTGIFSVINSGPTVTNEELVRLMRPFERGNTKVEGSGLGLAIAKAIVEGSNARFEILSPASTLSDGFEVRIQLPVKPPECI